MLVVGGNHLGRRLSEELRARGETVVFLDDDPNTVERAYEAGLTAERLDITDLRSLRRADVGDVETAVVASDSDSVNILAAQLLSAAFDVERIVVRVDDPRNHSAFDDMDVETVCATDALTAAFAASVSLPEENA